MVDRRHLEALATVRGAAKAADVVWALTGSLSFALQGVSLEPSDVDVQTDAEGAYALERQLADAVVEPVSPSTDRDAGIRSHYGALEVAGVRVELMGDVRKRFDGAWEPPVDVAAHRRWVSVDGLEGRVPVLSLEYEATAYERLGRTERATLLREHLEAGSDG